MKIKQSLRNLGLVGALLFSTDAAFSATRTYEGGGGNNLWSNELNWNGDTDIAPGDVVVFGISGDTTINNDLTAGFSIAGITFAAGVPATTVAGNLINFSGGLQNDSGNLQTVNLDLNLTANAFAAAGTTTIGGTVSGTGGVSVNSGSLTLNSGNSYSGGSIVQGTGTLQLGTANALGTGGFAFAGGVLNANSFSDTTIGALTLVGASTLNLSPGGAAGSLTFDNVALAFGSLTINDWTGLAGSAGTDDRIFITVDPGSGFLNVVNFTGFDPGALWLGTGEIVPVPEPTEWALIIFATLALLYKFVLPRFRKTVVAC